MFGSPLRNTRTQSNPRKDAAANPDISSRATRTSSSVNHILNGNPPTTADFQPGVEAPVRPKGFFRNLMEVPQTSLNYVVKGLSSAFRFIAQKLHLTKKESSRDADDHPVMRVKYELASGEFYTGHMVDGKPSGSGILEKRITGEVFSGNFREGKLTGSGVIRNPSQNIESKGVFVKGVLQGDGTVENKSTGELYKGTFVDGELHGRAKLTKIHTDGSTEIQTVTFDHGKLSGPVFKRTEEKRSLGTDFRKNQVTAEIESDYDSSSASSSDTTTSSDDTFTSDSNKSSSKSSSSSSASSSVDDLDDIDIELYKIKEALGDNIFIKVSGTPERLIYEITGEGYEYTGEVAEGKFEGQGVLKNERDGEIYRGSFKNGLYDGQGVLIKDDKFTPGVFKAGKLIRLNDF